MTIGIVCYWGNHNGLAYIYTFSILNLLIFIVTLVAFEVKHQTFMDLEIPFVEHATKMSGEEFD